MHGRAFPSLVLIAGVLAMLGATACSPPLPAVRGLAIERREPARGPGVHRLSLLHHGRTRTWTVVVPPTGSLGGITVILHGVGGTGEAMRTFGFEPLAAERGAVLAFPDAVDGSWNDGRAGVASVAHREQVDDVGFLVRLVDMTAAETGAEPERFSVIGFSNGAMMASRLACEQATRVRRMVLVAAAAGAHQPAACHPTAPVGVLLIASTTDPIVPFAGGVVNPASGGTRGEAAPVEAVRAGWASVNGCDGEVVTMVPGAPVTEIRSTGCLAPVVLDRLDDGGHEWWRFPGFDTTATAWAFVSAS